MEREQETERIENNINTAFIDEYKVNERDRWNYLTNYNGLNLSVLWSVLVVRDENSTSHEIIIATWARKLSQR